MPTPAEQAEALALIASAERARRKAALQAEIDAGDAEHRERQASGYYRGAIPGPTGAPDALPPPGPTTGTPGPVQAAPGGSQLAPWARDLIRYAGQTVGNIPQSAENVATGIYEAVTNPGETLDAAGRLLVGTGQTVNEAVGLPEWARLPGGDLGFGDQRATAAAAGQALADRYGGWEQLGTTFRDDPVGFGLDVAGLTGGAAALARAPGVAGRLPGPFVRPAAQTRRPPLMMPEDVRVMTDAGDAVREGVGRVRGAAADARRRERGTRAFIEGAPTTEALRRQGDAFFDAVRRSGVRFPARDFGPFRKKLTRTLREEGADVKLNEPIASLIRQIEDAPPGLAPDMGNLMILRRRFGRAGLDRNNPDNARLAGIAVDLIDDFVESGSASASGMMKLANRVWSQMRKAETIETAILKARDAQQGFEAGLRAEFKSLQRAYLNKDKRMRGFTPDEAKAIRDVARGNWTINTLRVLAGAGGGRGASRQFLNAMAGGGFGYGVGTAIAGPIIGGPIGAGAMIGAGRVAAGMAERGTKRRADRARAIVARGETPKQARKAPQDSTLAELLADYMETSP